MSGDADAPAPPTIDPVSLPPDTAPPAADHTRRNVGIALGAGALLLLGGYAAAVAAVSGDVPAGTSVRGVDIGGMTTQQAAETLEQELGEQAAAPIPVTAGEATTEIEPAEAGLAVDWVATADQASGVILNPVALWAHLRGNVEVEPITTVDEPALSAAVTALDEVVAVEAVEPQITYPKAKPVAPKLSPGAPGSTLDVPASVDLVSEQYFADPQPTVDLPMTSVPPTISEQEAASVMTSFAEPAVALPVLVDLGEAKVTASAADIAAALSFAAKDGTLEPTLDAEKLRARMAEDLAPYETRGKDASFSVKGGQPVVIPSRAGTEVDTDELGKAVLVVLPETTADARVAEATVAKSQPEFTTADAKALNITEKLSSFRQWFPPAQYRYINVGQAAKYLNGTVLEPGETFSMNDTIKERTVANGYTQGTIISGGAFKEELGGGVSIITTATWTAGFYAGLERVEQHAHSLYISRYKAGLEATVAWGLKDLKLRNDTGNGVLITATRFSDGVLIEMWGTKKYDDVTATFTNRSRFTDYETIYDERDTCVPSEGSQGFSIAVTRRLIRNGAVARSETIPTVYRPTPNVICGPKPK